MAKVYRAAWSRKGNHSKWCRAKAAVQAWVDLLRVNFPGTGTHMEEIEERFARSEIIN